MASKRRYAVGKYRDYSRTFDAARLSSNILNAGGQSISAFALNLSNRESLQQLVWQLEGAGPEGKFYDTGGHLTLAAIPSLQADLKQLEERWEEIQEEKRKEGWTEEPKLPSDMLNKRLELEAYLDVREEELETLKGWIAKIDEKLEKERGSEVLAQGIRMTGQLRNNKLILLDGQRISQTEEGEYYIDDENSKYDGMSLVDYRKLFEQVCQWRKKQMKQARKDKKEGKRSKPVPQRIKGPLPPWPANAKNYKSIIKDGKDRTK